MSRCEVRVTVDAGNHGVTKGNESRSKARDSSLMKKKMCRAKAKASLKESAEGSRRQGEKVFRETSSMEIRRSVKG